MIGKSQKESHFLNKEECFDLYLKLGSLAAVRRYFEAQGYMSEQTGVAPTRQAIFNATWTYVLFNIPVAKKKLSDYYMSKGLTLTDDAFNDMLIKYGKAVLNENTYKRIMKREGLYERANLGVQ